MTEIPTLTMPGGGAIPRLGLGTWPLAGAEGQAAVESALALGYRHIDTAEMYGNEAEVGAAIAASGLPRGEVFLTTKVWHTHLTPDGIRAAAAQSLAKLRTPYADLYLIHWPDPGMDLEACLGALAALKREGLARAVGVSNFPPGLLRRAIAAGIVEIGCLQVEHHLWLDQSRLLEICRAHGIPLTSYSPVAKGRPAEDPVVQGIARKHDCTPVQVALAWLLGMEGVVAIPKAASPANQAANLASLGVALDAEDRAAIAALPKDRRLVNPAFAPDWAA
jgi:2,5-diketo-D-gluconate reductase B